MLVVLTETYYNKVNIQITQGDDFIQKEAKKIVCCKYTFKLSDVGRYIMKFCNYSFTVVQLYPYDVDYLS